jgi:hypothetical protein
MQIERLTILRDGDDDLEAEPCGGIASERGAYVKVKLRSHYVGTNDVEGCPIVVSAPDGDIYSGTIANASTQSHISGKRLILHCTPASLDSRASPHVPVP